jgi:hypothetical protein
MGNNRYKMDDQSLLKGCTGKSAVEEKIKQFKQHIAKKPPQIWLDFFKKILNQYKPLTAVESLKIYKLADNPELMQLMARDSVLKKYILKVEGGYVAIQQKEYAMVKKRLLALGYLQVI